MDWQQVDVPGDEDGEGELDLDSVVGMRQDHFAARGARVHLPVPLVRRGRGALSSGGQLRSRDEILSLQP
jgi:hypothetical protein